MCIRDRAVENGELEEEILDRTVERILKVVFSYTDNRKAETVFDREKDHKAAADIETECAVLLENRGVLPLKKEQKVVYIGEFAKKPRYQGGGSSHINTDLSLIHISLRYNLYYLPVFHN